MIRELATNYGTMFVPDTDDGQYSWLLNSGGSPEDNFIEEVCGLFKGGCAVDVGANFGCWTLPLASHAAEVVAYEPQPKVFDMLLQSITANLIENIYPRNWAVGDQRGQVMIPDLDIEIARNFGGIGLIDMHGGPFAQVPMVTLDWHLKHRPVSFIKIDVEGYEHKVIKGAAEVIRRCRPVLFVEMDHPHTDGTALRLEIEAMGYVTDKRQGNYLCMPL